MLADINVAVSSHREVDEKVAHQCSNLTREGNMSRMMFHLMSDN